MQSYQPQNSFPSTKESLFVSLYLIIGAVIIISPIGYFSTLSFFPPVPPLLMGWFSGLIQQFVVKRWKIASPLYITFCAILMGITSYVGLQYGLYWRFLGEVREAIVQDTGITDYTQTNQMTDDFLVERTGSAGLGGYLQLMAETGVSVSRISQTFGNLTVMGLAAWLFWLFELLVIIAISGFMGRQWASRPFCYTCNNWYDYEHIGGTTPEKQPQLLALLQSSDYVGAGRMIKAEGTPYPSVELYVGECHCDEAEMKSNVIRISRARRTSMNNIRLKDIAFGVVSPDQADELSVSVPE